MSDAAAIRSHISMSWANGSSSRWPPTTSTTDRRMTTSGEVMGFQPRRQRRSSQTIPGQIVQLATRFREVDTGGSAPVKCSGCP